MENFERFDLTEVTDELVNEVIPNAEELNLTVAQIKVLALLKYISRIDKKDEDGYFFVENDFIRKVCKIGSKSTLNNAFGILVESGYIDRISSRVVGKASKYRVHFRCTKVYTGEVTDNQVVTENKNTTCTPNCTSNCTRNCTIDIESDKDIDIEKEKNIYNIIKENNNNLINIIEEKENNIINNIIKEKEKSSSIEINNKEQINTQMEKQLQQQINELKEQNKILTSRLNDCARQFKLMINTMRELQQKNNSLEEQINQLKENKTSTAFCGDAVEDAKEVKKEETIPTVEGRKDKEEIKTIDVEVKPSTAFCGDAVEAKKKQSPTEEEIPIEEILEYFKENFKDPQEARKMETDLLEEYKKNKLSYYNRRDLELRLNKYIKSLELKNSTEQEVKEEIPTVVMEVKPIEEEVKETIPTMEVEVAQLKEELPQEAIKEAKEVITSRNDDKATEEKKTTFVGNFQTNEGDSDASDEMLRYQDIKTKTYYKTLEEAQAAEVNPMYLYDYEVSRCVSSY